MKCETCGADSIQPGQMYCETCGSMIEKSTTVEQQSEDAVPDDKIVISKSLARSLIQKAEANQDMNGHGGDKKKKKEKSVKQEKKNEKKQEVLATTIQEPQILASALLSEITPLAPKKLEKDIKEIVGGIALEINQQRRMKKFMKDVFL